MKKIYFFLVLLGITLLSGCDEDFLNKYPKDELSDDSFWKKDQDAVDFLNSVYNSFPDFLIDDDVMSDNALHGIKWAEGDVAKGIYDPLDGKFSGHWADNYANIRRTNVLLENIDKIEDMDPDLKKNVLAQAHFFRGWLHFELIKVFGDVPLVDHSLLLEETYTVERDPLNKVLTFVLDELQLAADGLPVTWAAEEYGRVTRGAALAMKARVELFYGMHSQAAADAKRVMDLKIYDLFGKAEQNGETYQRLFWAESEGNKEVILDTQRKQGDKGNWFKAWCSLPGFGWGGINPTQSLVDEFECIDGLTIAESSKYDPANPFNNRDPRLEVTILHHGETFQGTPINTRPVQDDYPRGVGTHRDATSTGYYQQKFLDPNLDYQANAWDEDLNWMIIRYAEVLLTYAEATNEEDGPVQGVYDAVNAIRNRVGMPNLPEDLSKDQMRARIRREWRVEFGMEGMRWMNIRRWDIGMEVLNGQFYGMRYDSETQTPFVGDPIPAGVPRKYESHNRLWPIPQDQRDLNENLSQNDKY